MTGAPCNVPGLSVIERRGRTLKLRGPARRSHRTSSAAKWGALGSGVLARCARRYGRGSVWHGRCWGQWQLCADCLCSGKALRVPWLPYEAMYIGEAGRNEAPVWASESPRRLDVGHAAAGWSRRSATSHCSGRLRPAASERGVRVKKAGIVITVTSGLATRDRTAGGAAAGIETEGLTVRNPRVSSGQAHFQRQSEANRGENPPA
jgi:hypothetical protein